MGQLTMHCGICGSIEDNLLHLPLYVNGSEGIDVCERCRVKITVIIQQVVSVANKARCDERRGNGKQSV
jgi:hypothetical protein